ncbi:GNAT family N-acetyltransferase [Clostridium tagluense]|uniref:GNAT family N-acetyltransferase n=1 Tax=Clostridium tagluense TaxID=360422 RepID=UPI001C6F4081|nr:GNAT family N-acetyltransferase [Clostridium tagluense]MBW9157714.1 GNAT family N-acetyltransferase [Clostridium tagluense]WLC66833.1 GNAT family N-acetyltransferase [Clostridium tagluense]
MNIFLREIDANNWSECVNLKIKKEQEAYLPHPNVVSIAEWKFNPTWTALGIYTGNEMIGFAMYGVDIADNTMCLFRFMIDENYQGKGYGKYALDGILKKIKSENNFNEIWLSFHPESIVAERLYSSFGFKPQITGLEADDEVFYVLKY